MDSLYSITISNQVKMRQTALQIFNPAQKKWLPLATTQWEKNILETQAESLAETFDKISESVTSVTTSTSNITNWEFTIPPVDPEMYVHLIKQKNCKFIKITELNPADKTSKHVVLGQGNLPNNLPIFGDMVPIIFTPKNDLSG